MEKRAVILALTFMLCIGFVSAAEVDKEKAITWINQNVDVNSNVRDVSLASLALKSSAYSSKAQALITSLQSRMDEEGCFPKDNCNVRDTAFALIALNDFNKPVDKLASWLKKASSSSGSVGNWFVQVTTENTGICKFSSGNFSKEVTVNDNQNTDCGSPWISVGSGQCFNIDLSKNPVTDISVDCSALNDPDAIISLLSIKENEFSIISQPIGSFVTLSVNDFCWGAQEGASCDLDSTAYAYWALSELTNIEVPPFLASAQSKNALHYAILHQSTNQQVYLNWLAQNQNQAGYWDDQSIFKTAIASYSLESSLRTNISKKSLDWLGSQQRDTGSFSNDVYDTSAVIYFTTPRVSGGGFGGLGTRICGDNTLDVDLGEECDGLDDDACSGQCVAPGLPNECTCEAAAACLTNDDCGSLFCDSSTGHCVECLRNTDCSSGEVCNLRTNTCEQDIVSPVLPSQEDSPVGLILTIFGILVVLAAIYFVYKKYLNKPKSAKPSQGPSYLAENKAKQPAETYKPSLRRYKPEDEHLESELDKSIKEAQKLLERK